MSTETIESNFVRSCSFSPCKKTQHGDSKEPEITYKSSDGKNHVIWFDDADSVKAKEQFLKSQGIQATSMWAYSYF